MVVEYMGEALRNSFADRKEKVYEGGAFAGQVPNFDGTPTPPMGPHMVGPH